MQKKERIFLVFEFCLKSLFKYCPKCGVGLDSTMTTEVPNTGTQLKLKFNCMNGCDSSWVSQPEMQSTRGLGNLSITSAIEMAGLQFNKMKRFAKVLYLKFLDSSTYYRLRGDYVFPEIYKAWRKHKSKLIDDIKQEDRQLELALDGQCDTPGHNATYSTVSAMDVKTNKIIEFNIVHVREVKNSQNMEKEGFIRCLENIQEKHKLQIEVVATDRHGQIRKLMRTDPRFNHIFHQFDPWHIAKGFVKKLTKASKKKGFHLLAEWAPATVNHLYWSVLTCNGDPNDLRERFCSIMHHVVNRHSNFVGNKNYLKCEHGELNDTDIRRKKWLKKGTQVMRVQIYCSSKTSCR
ncbi:uncharacterized protein LOC130636732 [Hydractinia symbiolongicarpus]|uniref:uncharacterized protein LOC130636732 n=1 Tax=Hydractinia symbiolongicarpus TaxID=13093 RepID=UPI00254F81B1|nr:uncharacterized protein LOC130636732 [Hydractinia symbiolongicarpus]